MHPNILTVVRLTVVAVLPLVLSGCATTGSRAAPVAGTTATSGSETPATQAGVDSDQTVEEAEKKAKEEEKEVEEAAKDARQHAKLERDLAIARQRVVQAHMAHGHAEAQHAAAVAKAERELEVEVERLRIFTERSAPNRIERTRLEFARAKDRAKEAEEELRQLEIMYAEEDFADQTKEIVLERGRRRLERARRDLELRAEILGILTERTIPLETAEHELKVEDKTRANEKVRREADASRLDKQIGLISAEAEVARLEAEIDALREKMEKRHKDHEKSTN